MGRRQVGNHTMELLESYNGVAYRWGVKLQIRKFSEHFFVHFEEFS